MRIAIEWQLCIGSGLCVKPSGGCLALVPYQGQERAIVVDGTGSGEALLAAARACPTLAITLVDERGHSVYPPPDSVAASDTDDQATPPQPDHGAR